MVLHVWFYGSTYGLTYGQVHGYLSVITPKSDVFYAFWSFGAKSGPQGCQKMPKKSFELDLSKEALISKNG